MARGPGGAQPGAGRPQGSANKKTQELVARAMAQGITPVEVLLLTMRSLWETATTKDKAVIAGLEKQGRTQHSIALEACEIATKAAPYVHPKLVAQQVTFTGESAADYFKEIAGRLPV